MKNIVALLVASVAVILLSLTLFPLSLQSKKPSLKNGSVPSSVRKQPNEEVVAAFQIYIHGLPKDLSSQQFIGLSERANISSDSPGIVHVYDTQMTWGEFFETLPLTVTESCFTSELNREFCTQGTEQLQFYLNEKPDPELLEKPILFGDRVLITFGDLTSAEIHYQLSQVPKL